MFHYNPSYFVATPFAFSMGYQAAFFTYCCCTAVSNFTPKQWAEQDSDVGYLLSQSVLVVRGQGLQVGAIAFQTHPLKLKLRWLQVAVDLNVRGFAAEPHGLNPLV